MLYQPHSMVKRKKWVFLWKSLQSVDQGKHVVDAKTFVLHLQGARNMREKVLTQAEEECEDGGSKLAGVELEAKEEAERESRQESEDFWKNKFVILTSRQLSLSLFLEQLTDSDEASESKKQSILDSAASEEHEEDERQHLEKVVINFSWYSNIFWLSNIQTRTADKPSKKNVFEVAPSISGSGLILYWGHKTCSSSPLKLLPIIYY